MSFYASMKPATTLASAFDRAATAAVPTNWFVLLTDIKGSTRAIEEGRYKDVNTAGGLAAMALSNEFGSLEFPFIFGGDGAVFLVPPEIKERAGAVLLDTARKVKEFFNLELRVGIVPVSLLAERGLTLRVGKIKVSPYYTQAIISGDGMDVAEALVKKDDSYLVRDGDFPERAADFSGFTCRWQDIPSDGGETVALIISLKGRDEAQNESVLQRVLTLVEKHYGPEKKHHPVKEERMKASLSPRTLWREAAARAGRKRGPLYLLQLLRILSEVFITILIMGLKLPGKAFHYKLKDLRWYNVISSDYKKYDGMLKMVISGTAAMREKLVADLSALRDQQLLNYGLHISNRALLTCLLHAESAQEVHFVDAADGGYALAARMLKAGQTA